jgi:hypothetical protein
MGKHQQQGKVVGSPQLLPEEDLVSLLLVQG